jgi:hypothetical protein
MGDAERDLLPTDLRKFFVEGATITHYLRARAGLPTSWFVRMVTDEPPDRVLELYRELGRRAGAYFEERSPHDPLEVDVVVDGVAATVYGGRETAIDLRAAAPPGAPSPPRPAPPPAPGECFVGEAPLGEIHPAMDRRRDTTPLDAP